MSGNPTHAWRLIALLIMTITIIIMIVTLLYYKQHSLLYLFTKITSWMFILKYDWIIIIFFFLVKGDKIELELIFLALLSFICSRCWITPPTHPPHPTPILGWLHYRPDKTVWGLFELELQSNIAVFVSAIIISSQTKTTETVKGELSRVLKGKAGKCVRAYSHAQESLPGKVKAIDIHEDCSLPV